MTQRFVESFAIYGQGAAPPGGAILLNMLAGRWASFRGLATYTIGQLPWAPTDTDLYFSCGAQTNGNPGARVVLPVSAFTYIVSEYFALSNLPTGGPVSVVTFCDSSNNFICGLYVLTTGAFALTNAAGAVIAETSGSVLTAQSAAHIEMSCTSGAGGSCAFELQVNGATVINATGLTFSQTGQIAQLRFFDFSPTYAGEGATICYMANLILRDTAGSYNNSIVGDRRVATLWPDADDATAQGWTGEPLHLFGNGILDNTAGAGSGNGVRASATAALDIGTNPFTIEGWFRFQTLPTGSNQAVLFSRWDLPNNNASFMLYVGGPTLENGNTVFVISTDGKADTRVELIDWAVNWQTGVWYHVAVARDGSNNTRLFVNGVLQGLAVADANDYYSAGLSGPIAVLGADWSAGAVVNTSFNGWQDEFRFTNGFCRYAANFTPPAAAFPRGGLDAEWAYVVWISGWDLATIVDESSYARSLTAFGGTLAITPNDGTYNYQTINKASAPNDNTFIQAALVAATNVLTYTAAPTNGDTVIVGQKTGPVAAVYTWTGTTPSAPFQVLNPGTIAGAVANLAAAINLGAGAGTVYGTGTTANLQVSANVLPSEQLLAQALTAGAAGNSIASTTNDTNATWEFGATLSGGQSIPGPSRFYLTRLPSNTTLVDSLCLVSREWKTDAGACQVQASLVGAGGGAENGGNYSITTAPTFYSDMFELDPDTSSPITPTTVLLARVEYNRTA